MLTQVIVSSLLSNLTGLTDVVCIQSALSRAVYFMLPSSVGYPRRAWFKLIRTVWPLTAFTLWHTALQCLATSIAINSVNAFYNAVNAVINPPSSPHLTSASQSITFAS